ncbi:MAG: hypothetical protein H7246_20380 [Phycisphaerae bacterium]|nr:hypothetical protein [Saprospiraceae bacterium]
MPSKSASKTYNIGEGFAPGPILSTIEDLDQSGVIPETVLRVVGARVVYANYALLQHDFPQLRDRALEKEFPRLSALNGGEKQKAISHKMDEWLIRNTAFVSQSQAKQSFVNTPIATGNERVTAFRPPAYGRAHVFSIEENDKGLLLGGDPEKPVFENRLIDVKGTGVAPNVKPDNGAHSNGIYRLGYALFELIVQELLQGIFRHSKSAVQTLPVYAIIDLGFDEQNNWMHNSPAGLLVRRAHRRPKDSGGLYPYGSTGQQVQLEIEQLLRKYGITSNNSVTTVKVKKENGQFEIYYGDQHVDFFNEAQKTEIENVSHYKDGVGELSFEGINIQHTREIGLKPTRATLVDFQAYYVKEAFENPVLSLVSDKLLRWGGSILPDYADFVRPDPALQIPFHLMSDKGTLWGYEMAEAESKMDSLCYGMAEDFRANRMTREMILATIQAYLDALTAHWNE